MLFAANVCTNIATEPAAYLFMSPMDAGVDFDCQSEEPIQLVKEAFFQLEPPKGFQKTYTLIMFLPMSIPLLT